MNVSPICVFHCHLKQTDEKKRKELSKDGKFKDNSGGKKKKKKTEQRSRSVCADDEEQPGPSSLLIPSQRKSKKMCFCKLPPPQSASP